MSEHRYKLKAMSDSGRRFEIIRTVALPRAEVWELLANNDRFNQVVELPEVIFSPPAPTGSLLVRAARSRLKKLLTMRWQEHPFQWVKEAGYSVLRVYEEGPLKRVFVGIQLADDVPGSTKLTVFAEMLPANALVAALLPLVAKGMLEKTAKYCEDAVMLRRSGKARALPINPRLTPVDEACLAPLIEALSRAPVSHPLILRLREYLHEADDSDVAGLRPKRLARLWDAAEEEVLRLCLHATKVGLLNLSWHEMCPNCRVSKSDVSSLSQLSREVHCDLCGVNYEVNFDRYVELRFAVHSNVRAASAAIYCIGSPFRTPHILAQLSIEAGGMAHLPIPNAGEELRLRVLRFNHVLALDNAASPEGAIYRDEGWAGERLGAPPGATLGIHNRSGHDIVLALEKVRWDDDAVTAAEVTSLREFREMFSSEVLAPGQSVGIESLALFFSDLCDSTQLYENVGDAPAYGRVRRHFAWMSDIIGTHRGTIVKTIGDAVMAVFQSPEDALRAAIEVQTRIDEFNATLPPDEGICVRIGLHHGPAIVINSNDRLDYFGRTVNLAARIENAGSSGDILFSDEVGNRPAVLEILRSANLSLRTQKARLKGIESEQFLTCARVRKVNATASRLPIVDAP